MTHYPHHCGCHRYCNIGGGCEGRATGISFDTPVTGMRLDGWVSPRASNAHAHILNACACAFDGIGYVRQGELRSMLYGNWVMSSEKALFNFKSRCTVETQLGSPTQPPTSKWPLYLTASPIFTPHIICSTHRFL